MEKRTAVVLGLGEVGQPIYKMLAKAYGADEVRGWDSGFYPDASLGISRAMDEQTFTFMHVCYPQLPGFIESVKEYNAQYKPRHIIVHSTVSPGILEALQVGLNFEAGIDIHGGMGVLVHFSPVRGNLRDGMEECLKYYTKYIGSVYYREGGSLTKIFADRLREAASHLKGAGFTIKSVNGIEGLVWAKLLDLAWYGLNIAFYQELERIVRGGHYELVKGFITSTPLESEGKVQRELFYGGFIGGHCVTQAIEKILADRDVPMLRAVLDSNLKRAVELAYDEKPPHHP